jgi:hypothetical protein
VARIESPDGPLEMEAGGSVRVEVRVTHAGTGQAWPSDVEFPLRGVVRVGGRWYDGAGAVVQAAEWAPLAGPMWPGDQQVVSLELRAIDAGGRPLEPGRYVVGIDMVQADVAWFSDEGAEALRIEVEVS